MIRLRQRFVALITFVCLFSGCAGAPLFGPIGDNLSAPIAIALDPVNQRAYVLNSNLNVAYADASMMVLDLSTATAPTLLALSGNPVTIPGLSGQIYLDAVNQRIFFTNRFSENPDDTIDHLFRMSVKEDSSFGMSTQFDAGSNPFGLVCCDAADQLLAVSDGNMEVYPRTDPGAGFQVSLNVTLSNSEDFEGLSTTRVVILGNQAFLSNRAGIIYVLNLDKIANPADNPIDYLITNMEDLRGITTDGTNIYVAEVAFSSSDDSLIRVIDPASVPPIAAVSPAVIEVEITDTRDVNGMDIAVQKEEINLGPDSEPTEVLVFKSNLYVADTEKDQIYIFDIADPNDVVGPSTVAVGDGAFGLAAATFGASDLLYVTNLNDNTISIIELGSNSVVGSFP